MSLLNAAVIITGASSGIGAAIARELSRSGANLVLLGRNAERLRGVLAGERTNLARHMVVDFEQPEQVGRAARALRDAPTPIRALIHAAAEYDAARLGAGPSRLSRLLQINVRSAIDLTLELRPVLDANADIVFINSSIVLRPALGAVYYAATKHALRALADSLRAELNGTGTRVTSLFLGKTDTPMQEQVARSERRAYAPECMMQPSDVAQIVRAVLELPRTAEVTDLFMRPTQPSHGTRPIS